MVESVRVARCWYADDVVVEGMHEGGEMMACRCDVALRRGFLHA